MGENSGIQWTDHTFNIVWGCVEKVDVIDGKEVFDPACQNCYARTFAKAKGHDVWGTDKPRRLLAGAWSNPAKWNRAAEKSGKRARVFCSSMADVFEDHPTVGAERLRLWSLIAATPFLDWQLLTKRHENIMAMVPESWRDGFPANVWIGTTVADQSHADLRIPHLLAIPAAVRFLSVEPMLGAVKLERYMWPTHWGWDAKYRTPEEALSAGAHAAKHRQCLVSADATFVDWVIIGGESGPKARPFDLDAARRIVTDCKDAGVPVFVKQMGERWARDTGTHKQDAHGGTPELWPEDLRVREMPEPRA